jgi:1,4-alpha-glucan branching enzyme
MTAGLPPISPEQGQVRVTNFASTTRVDVPDPASDFQPQDVNKPSELIDHDAYSWQATEWRGRPWHETVLIESHVVGLSF